MSLWTAEQLARFEAQAEESFCNETKCLIERVCLSIVSGTSLYTLPDEVIDIRRVTYRGIRIYPMSHRNSRKYFDGLNPSGTPYNYIFDNLGSLVIKLFPTPIESITSIATGLYSPSVVQARCIVEYYRSPDGIRFKLPTYFRRRFLKAFVLKQAFLAEGKGQNLKAAKYWSAKWTYLKEEYTSCIYDLCNTPRRLVASQMDNDLIKKLTVPRPVLPLDMIGIGVDPYDE